MTENLFISNVLGITKNCRHPIQTIDSLEVVGFELISSGALKKVFYLPGTAWVVKVFRKRTDWYYDHSTCGIIPTELLPYWLRNIFVCRRFVIQPLVNNIGGDSSFATDFFKRRFGKNRAYERFDIWHNNARYHNGKPVLIDFTDKLKSVFHPKYRWPAL